MLKSSHRSFSLSSLYLCAQSPIFLLITMGNLNVQSPLLVSKGMSPFVVPVTQYLLGFSWIIHHLMVSLPCFLAAYTWNILRHRSVSHRECLGFWESVRPHWILYVFLQVTWHLVVQSATIRACRPAPCIPAPLVYLPNVKILIHQILQNMAEMWPGQKVPFIGFLSLWSSIFCWIFPL